jgi:hypothetical protein
MKQSGRRFERHPDLKKKIDYGMTHLSFPQPQGVDR